jgi:hypothetical protein
MQFSICIPELCLIRFAVKDNDKSSTDLGQYSIPFLSMQHGKYHGKVFHLVNMFFLRLSTHSIT